MGNTVSSFWHPAPPKCPEFPKLIEVFHPINMGQSDDCGALAVELLKLLEVLRPGDELGPFVRPVVGAEFVIFTRLEEAVVVDVAGPPAEEFRVAMGYPPHATIYYQEVVNWLQREGRIPCGVVLPRGIDGRVEMASVDHSIYASVVATIPKDLLLFP